MLYIVAFTREFNHMYVCNSVYCRMNVTSPTSENSKLHVNKRRTLQESYTVLIKCKYFSKTPIRTNQMYWHPYWMNNPSLYN